MGQPAAIPTMGADKTTAIKTTGPASRPPIAMLTAPPITPPNSPVNPARMTNRRVMTRARHAQGAKDSDFLPAC